MQTPDGQELVDFFGASPIFEEDGIQSFKATDGPVSFWFSLNDADSSVQLKINVVEKNVCLIVLDEISSVAIFEGAGVHRLVCRRNDSDELWIVVKPTFRATLGRGPIEFDT